MPLLAVVGSVYRPRKDDTLMECGRTRQIYEKPSSNLLSLTVQRRFVAITVGSS